MESTMVLTGYVGQDVDLRSTKTGVPTAAFRVGTTPRMWTQDGWVDATTTWTNVVCYRALAQNVAASVAKGDPVIIQGRVRTQSWTDASGGFHEKLVVEASAVGHDLNRGASSFSRVQARPVNGAGGSEEVGTDQDWSESSALDESLGVDSPPADPETVNGEASDLALAA